MKHTIIHNDCYKYLCKTNQQWDCIFADPPDNLGLKYNTYNDKLSTDSYAWMLHDWIYEFIKHAPIVWLSYNSKWTFEVGYIVCKLLDFHAELEAKQCIQTFTFGQHNQKDLANCYRPLLRIKKKSTPLYPENIRVKSWRQLHGDKRANPKGRIPGDIFDFPRVTGNSKQRRNWCPTQLHEGLVERCIKLSTPENGTVLDPFGGSGTTLRVCNKINRNCTTIEIDEEYCKNIGGEYMDLYGVYTANIVYNPNGTLNKIKLP
jgi:DNA modification methylase